MHAATMYPSRTYSAHSSLELLLNMPTAGLFKYPLGHDSILALCVL